MNHLLVVGFYLINIGYIALALRTTNPLTTVCEAIEFESTKVGIALLILGGMHFFNMYVLARTRSRQSYLLRTLMVGGLTAPTLQRETPASRYKPHQTMP